MEPFEQMSDVIGASLWEMNLRLRKKEVIAEIQELRIGVRIGGSDECDRHVESHIPRPC